MLAMVCTKVMNEINSNTSALTAQTWVVTHMHSSVKTPNGTAQILPHAHRRNKHNNLIFFVSVFLTGFTFTSLAFRIFVSFTKIDVN